MLLVFVSLPLSPSWLWFPFFSSLRGFPLPLSLAAAAELGARETNLAPVTLALGKKAASKSSRVWLWWMCGTAMCNLPVGGYRRQRFNEFSWRISECSEAAHAQIYGRLSLQVFFINLMISNKEGVELFSFGQTKLCSKNILETCIHGACVCI